MNNISKKSIILFDGVCNLCNASVNFIIKHDKQKQFLFASLQSDAAKEILLQFPLKKIDLTSIILIKDEVYYDKSTAALLVFKQLKGIYKWPYFFTIIPKKIRDRLYLYISKNRYNWFGKQNTCLIPSKEVKERFLD